VRELVADMERRALQLQAGAPEVAEAPDPLEEDPGATARIDVPALVAVGEHDLADFRDGAAALASTLPRSRHEVIAGAGHLAPLETPEEFRRLLLEFVAREGAERPAREGA
jgi:pimeloyl-ACP methyl ester carboxylesterase